MPGRNGRPYREPARRDLGIAKEADPTRGTMCWMIAFFRLTAWASLPMFRRNFRGDFA